MLVDDQALADVEDSYSLVVANIIHDVLVEMASDMRRVTEVGGKLVLSGILDGSQAESAISVYEKHDFILEKRRSMKEWAALLFKRVE
jgi:ribosomal protein L11 methyltransferase